MSQRFYNGEVTGDLANASGIHYGANPEYTAATFNEFYPQFSGIVPEAVLKRFIQLASDNIAQARWADNWDYAMGLFVAHYLTLWVKTSGTANNPSSKPQDGLAKGIVSSKSVDGVSVSYDINAVVGNIQGYGSYKTTEYGLQLITMARIVGKGAIYVV